jgi:hypothetical protein
LQIGKTAAACASNLEFEAMSCDEILSLGPFLYVNTFSPLVSTAQGRRASEEFNLPPFIDGSIRREPDLQHRCPAISCLCRAGKFVPRLKEKDFVVYLAAKRRYGSTTSHWRLAAVLQVIRTFENHRAAARWYRRRGGCPTNCMVDGNAPASLEQSHGLAPARGCSHADCLRRWENEYVERAEHYPRVVACRVLYRELCNPPIVHNRHLTQSFGCVPGTQNPRRMSPQGLRDFMRLLRIPVPRSVP